MPKNSRRIFTVIEGGGSTGAATTKSKLQIAAPTPKRIPIQLQMPLKGTLRPFVISAGFEDFSLSSFLRIICEYQIRYIIDMRVSPLFRGRGFNREAVEQELLTKGISYIHMPEFNNPFSDENIDRDLLLAKYSQYLESHLDLLQKIRKLISEGPILLLGWSSENDRSERDILLNNIAKLDVDFDLIVQ